MAQNAVIISAKYFFVDLLGGIVFFPVWWYSHGLARVAGSLSRAFMAEERSLAIGVWLKNLFVPMYNANDIAGRLISFFMRLVQIVGRTVVLGVYLVLLLLMLVLYVTLPVFVVFELLFHAFGVLLLV